MPLRADTQGSAAPDLGPLAQLVLKQSVSLGGLSPAGRALAAHLAGRDVATWARSRRTANQERRQVRRLAWQRQQCLAR